MDWLNALHEELANATEAVWRMQHAATEGTTPTELRLLAEKLKYRVDVITGHMARWEAWQTEQQQATLPERKPAPPDGGVLFIVILMALLAGFLVGMSYSIIFGQAG